MTVGYAAFQTNLDIKGTSKVSSNWDIRITNVRAGTITGDAEQAKQPTWNELTASVEANLYQKGDSIEYIITVENKGTIDAILNNINAKETTNEAIKFTYSGVNKNDKLYKGESTEIIVRIEYNPDFNGTPEIGSAEINITLEYIQAIVGEIEIINPNLYVSSKGNDETGIGSKTNPYKTIKKAYEEVKEEGTIYIMDDITQTETLNLNEDKSITITSDNGIHKILRNNTESMHLINISDGNITLQNITVDGNKLDIEYGLIGLDDKAHLVLGSNATLTNAIANVYNGGAIRFEDYTTAVLEINGGIISNNESHSGGAIHNGYGGKVIINSGTLKENKAIYHGGLIDNYGTLIINGGEISKNQAGGKGGAIFSNKSDNIIMQNVKILNNTAASGGGIWFECELDNRCGKMSIKDSLISDNISTSGSGGAIGFAYSVLHIENSQILNNKAQKASGGGISIAGSELKISGDTEINNNTAYGHGGGICLSNGVVATIDNVIIDGNKAINANGGHYSGGGIIVLNDSVLTLNNGIISNNYASNTGGGIRVYNGELIMNGGVIKKNATDGDGGGIEVHGDNNKVSKFTMNGGQIINNTAHNTGGGVNVGQGTYTRKAGIICGNNPTNSYETHAVCPAS